jgi:hypothetical protein
MLGWPAGPTTPHATFVRPDLGSFCRLDELGLQVVGQRLEPGRAVLACRVVETDEFARWCRRCGCEAAPRVIGVDEHCWRHTRRGEKYVTVIIDLTPIRDGPDAVAVMDPFHVVRLAGDALDQCRRRVQQATCGHRGRKGNPLYAARRTLHTGSDLLTDKQRQRLTALFADDEHVEVEATWGIYQHMIAAYREPDRKRGRELMQQLIGSISHSVPTVLREVITLGRTLKRRAVDVLAYFDRPGTSNGPTERSTAASNTPAAQPSASATSLTTSPDRFWRPAGSGPDYTLDHEEPLIRSSLRIPIGFIMTIRRLVRVSWPCRSRYATSAARSRPTDRGWRPAGWPPAARARLSAPPRRCPPDPACPPDSART